MSERTEGLQLFVDAAFAAFDEHVRDADGRRSISRLFKQLEEPAGQQKEAGSRLPVCDTYLSQAMRPVSATRESLGLLLERFQAIEPQLTWRRREGANDTASDNFADGHANAMIIGPGGLETRQDVWIGVTLMAPAVRYPDHDHGPEEVYLVMSDGEFQHGESGWFAPGIGGTFYNPPHIQHAMRSLDVPLLAFWALAPDTNG